jgi:hypothetical protein
MLLSMVSCCSALMEILSPVDESLGGRKTFVCAVKLGDGGVNCEDVADCQGIAYRACEVSSM